MSRRAPATDAALVGFGAGEREFDVLAVGGAGLDTVITLERLPSHDEKVVGALVGRLPGGPAANFACAAARLGLRVAALAAVGDDEAGRLIVEDFRRHGVDTSLIRVHAGRPSNFTVSLVDPSGEKAIVVVPMLDEPYSPDLAERVPPRVRLLYGMPDDRGRFGALARRARERGVEVMIDVEPTTVTGRLDLGALLADVDVASFNRAGFVAATGEQPTTGAARRLLRAGPRTVVVTLGSGGALAVTEADAASCPGYPVRVVDSTGAGDTFNAAFARGMLVGTPLAARLRFASAAAALAVTGLGPRGRLPTVPEVEAFVGARWDGEG